MIKIVFLFFILGFLTGYGWRNYTLTNFIIKELKKSERKMKEILKK